MLKLIIENIVYRLINIPLIFAMIIALIFVVLIFPIMMPFINFKRNGNIWVSWNKDRHGKVEKTGDEND